MKYFTFILLICSYCGAAAQGATRGSGGNGTLSGVVQDAASKKPIEYTTITIYETGSTRPANGGISNSKGIFKITDLPFGTYQVVIDFIGYTTIKKDSVQITPQQPNVSLGTIALFNHSSTMQNVTVVSSAPLVENKIDKIVYNVDRDITSQGGMATDVLKKVPQVFVDVDGNVELQGSSSIRFLINGKPSTMFGSSVADALQSIPASQIQSIEVITSPGAKYDAQGTGGIINIILKKSRMQGMNGNINLSGGTRLENGSLNLNYRHNNFGINAFSSSNAQLRSTTLNHLNRTSTDASNNSTTFIQQGSSSFTRNGYHAGVGIDWDITKKDNLSATVGYHNFKVTDQGTTYQDFISQDANGNWLGDAASIKNATNNFNNHSFDWNINYKKEFKKDRQELTISYNSSNGRNQSYYFQNQLDSATGTPLSGSTSNNPGTSNESELAIDYTQPVSEHFIVETGAKYVHDHYNSTADVYTLDGNNKNYFLDSLQSYALNYSRNVYAYYLSTNFSIGKIFDVKAGGRYEYTSSQVSFSNAHNVLVPSYYILVPSFILSHSFTDKQSVKLSYTHRIERPDYRDLNPFINLSDPHNISMGNPSLKPEQGNNFELAFNQTFDKETNISLSLIYRKNTDDISSYTNYYDTYRIGDSVYQKVSVTTRANINSDVRYGFNLSGALSLNQKLTLRTNIFAFNHVVNSFQNGGNTNSGYGYRMNLNATYLATKDLAIEMFGNFRSKETNLQGTQTSFISYNMALRKYFMNKKLSVGLTTTNPFNKYVDQTRTTFGSNFYQVSERQIPFRSFGINLVYKFGKIEFKKIRDEDPTNGSAPF